MCASCHEVLSTSGGPVERIKQKYDVVVIGSGIGGLTCAAYLAKNGLKPIVVEQHSVPGGYCTSFKRKQFTFDAAVHFLEGLGEGGHFHQILRDLGVEEEIRCRRLDPLYRVFFGEESFCVPADVAEYVGMLTERFPSEKRGISDLFRTIRKLNDENERLPLVLGMREKISVPLRFPLVFRYYKKTFSEMLKDFIRDPRLKSVISAGWPYVGLPPSRVSALTMAGYLHSAHFEGHYYPEGGTQTLVETLARALRRYGGELQLKTRVSKILTANGKAAGVEVEQGDRIGARYVVSNSDARQTFLNLLGPDKLPSEFLRHLEGMVPSISFFQVWLGCSANVRGTGEYEMLSYSSYDLDHMYGSCLQGGFGEGCGICIPTLMDPTLAPENNSIVSIIYPVPYRYEQNWRTEEGKRGTLYKNLKHEIAQQLIKTAERVVPELSGCISVMEAATPATLERYTLNFQGAAYGWDPTPEQSGTSRLQPKTPLENLYLTGHWTTPGGGTTTVALSGKNTARMILNSR
jgi:phytoene desaturase